MSPNLPPAIIIIGPTGSGKTPLGQFLEERGLPEPLSSPVKCAVGYPCAHFDFGNELRHAAQNGPAELSAKQLDVVNRMLKSGGLLEGKDIEIAEKLLRSFVSRNPCRVIVLNGFPRHVGQTEAVARFCDVRSVINLICSPEISLNRVGTNAGGDRTGRIDDSADFVRRKLDIFERQTVPLIEHYEVSGVAIAEVVVSEQSTPQEMLRSMVFRGKAR